MGFNTGTAIVGGAEGAQAGYNVGGPWGAAAGGISGALIGGFLFGGDPAMPAPGPMANMSDAEYNWYKENILTMQQKAYDKAFNPALIKQKLDQSSASADVNANNADAANRRALAGSGVVATTGQKAAMAKTSALNRGIAEVGARNATRASIGAQQSGILGIGG